MAARVTDGPDANWLDMAALKQALGLGETTIRGLIAKGEFPRACEITGKIRLWPWSDVVWWALNVEMKDRLTGGDEAEMDGDGENNSENLTAPRRATPRHASKSPKGENDA